VEPREGESESAVDCWMMIAAMKWVLLTIVFIGEGKMKCGKVQNSTHIRCSWKNILTKLPGVLAKQG